MGPFHSRRIFNQSPASFYAAKVLPGFADRYRAAVKELETILSPEGLRRGANVGLPSTPTEKPQVRLTIVLGSPGSAHDERIDILGTAESEMPTRAGHPGRAR